MPDRYDALVLVSFGGPEGPDDVIPFLQNVTRGRDVPPERLAVVARQYERFGGVSPINGQNRALLAAIERELAAHGPALRLYWGNRNWTPYLADAVAAMRDDGVERALAFVTSAYSSYSSCRQYLEDIERARQAVGPGAPVVEKLRAYFDHPGFVEAHAANLAAAMAKAPAGYRTEVVCTAHSLPVSMAGASNYVAQLQETARLVVERGAPGVPYHLAYQSRSGPPGRPWLEPDVNDVLAERRGAGVETVVVSPIGFVSDHIEVVYDLDVLARDRAADLGLTFVRAATPGTAAPFVAMVGELVRERTDPDAVPRTLSPRCAAIACGASGCCAPG